MSKNQSWVISALVAGLSIFPSIWVTSAYAASLGTMGVITPVHSFSERDFPISSEGKMEHVITFGTFENNFKRTNTDEPVVMNSKTFMQRWLGSMQTNKRNLLWASYPASIRGQVFSDNPAGGNPFQSGGW